MLILGCICPVSVAEDGTSTSTDLCVHSTTHAVLCSENPGNYNPVNSTQHQDAIYYYNEIWCDDCNTLLRCEFVRQEDDPSTLADHTFVDGVCTVCSYEACQHTSTEERTQTREETYEDCWHDASGHMVKVYTITQTVCTSCGEVISESEPVMDYATRDHTFNDEGVCSVCGQTYCPHTNAYWSDGDWCGVTSSEVIDKTYHRIMAGSLFYQKYCPDCDEIIDMKDEVVTGVDVVEKHILPPGGSACVVCGYVLTCEHPNASLINDEEWFVDSTSEEPAVPVPVDENTHRLSGCHGWELYCPDCELTLNWGFTENDTAVSAHTFVDGVCSACGYAQPCQHTDTTTVMLSKPASDWWDSNHGFQHFRTVEYYQQVVCQDCEAVLSETLDHTDTEAEDHAYEDGVCVKCGTPYCPHTSSTWGAFDREITEIEAVDQTYHKMSGVRYMVLWCDECGRELDGRIDPFTDEMEKHSLNSDGVCYECGYEATCDHANAYQTNDQWYVDFYSEDHAVPVPVDENTHRISGCHSWDIYCPDCDLVVDCDLIENDTAVSAHTFVDGVCSACGYAQPCQHTNTTTVMVSKPTEDWWNVNSGVQHVRSVDIYQQVVCEDCSAVLSETFDHSDYETEDHIYEDGACTVCGTPYCPHTTSTWGCFEREDTDIVIIDKTYHKVSGVRHMVLWCDECNLELDYRDDPFTDELEKHSLSSEGKCYYCDYQTTCDHANAYQTNDQWYVDFYSEEFAVPVPVDENTHRISGCHVWDVYCPDCDLVIDGGLIEEDSAEEPHNLDYGTCIDCGYVACDHPDAYIISGWETIGKCTPVDNTWHLVSSGTRFEDLYCPVCDQAISSTTEDLTNVQEKHTFDEDGLCSRCGLKVCLHSSTTSMEYCEDTAEVYQYDADKHRVVMDVYTKTTCNSCSEVLSDVKTGQTDDYRPHTLVKGVCTDCGYVCPHTNTTSAVITEDTDEIYPYSTEEHLVKVNQYNRTVCDDCGTEISKSFLGEQEAFRSHTMSDGVCTVCGWAGCEHTNAYTEEELLNYGTCVPVDKTYHVFDESCWSIRTYCPDCDTVIYLNMQDFRSNEQVQHVLNGDGVCTVCGYACPHSGTETQYRQMPGDAWYSSLDGYHHYREISVYEETVCLDCAKVLASIYDHMEYEQEDHVFENDVCVKCGDPYCAHTNASWYYDWITINSVTVVDQTYHIVDEGVAEHTKYCPDCGFMLESEDVTRTDVKEKHYLSEDGVCYTCGYETTCEHAHVSPINDYWAYDIDDVQPPVITVVDANSHRIDGYHWWANECQDCGLVIGDDYLENDSVVYPHETVDGVCTVCGYKVPVPTAVPTPTPTPKPAVKPTAVPTATPTVEPTVEPTAESTAEPTPLPEVIVVENVPVQQLDQLVEEVQTVQDEGVEVIIEVVGTEEVLTEEEYQQFTSFSVSEQLVVTLASIGLQDAIDAAVQSLGIELSEGATTLITQVTERQAALSEEEQAVVKEKLAELFPSREVVVDGVSYTCYIIDLRIVVDGVERIEQYAISLDEEGQWVFIKLDLE